MKGTTAASGTLNHQLLFIERIVLHSCNGDGEGLIYGYSTPIYLGTCRCLTESSNFHVHMIRLKSPKLPSVVFHVEKCETSEHVV